MAKRKIISKDTLEPVEVEEKVIEKKEIKKINLTKDGLGAEIPEDQFKYWEKDGWSKLK